MKLVKKQTQQQTKATTENDSINNTIQQQITQNAGAHGLANFPPSQITQQHIGNHPGTDCTHWCRVFLLKLCKVTSTESARQNVELQHTTTAEAVLNERQQTLRNNIDLTYCSAGHSSLMK